MEQPASKNALQDLSVAFHEAGHVAAHLYTNTPFVEVSIEATGLYRGRVYSKEVWMPPTNADPATLRCDPFTNHLILIKLAGPAARAKYKGASTADPGDYTDRNHALTIIDQLFTAREEASRQTFIEAKIKEAFNFVSGKDTWDFITLLAGHLARRKILSHTECLSLFRGHYLPGTQ